MIKAAFGATLRRVRDRKKFTQEALAAKSGVSVRYLQRLEAGERSPSISTVFRLANALDVTPNILVTPAWQQWLASGKPLPP